MKKSNSKRTTEVQFPDEHLTIGMDVGDAFTNYCVLNRNGEVVVEGRFATTRTGLAKFAAGLPQSRVALEAGIHSPWMSRPLSDIRHEVIVAHARNVRMRARARMIEHTQRGELDASFLATHRFTIDDGPRGYDMFKNKFEGCLRVVFAPQA